MNKTKSLEELAMIIKDLSEKNLSRVLIFAKELHEAQINIGNTSSKSNIKKVQKGA